MSCRIFAASKISFRATNNPRSRESYAALVIRLSFIFLLVWAGFVMSSTAAPPPALYVENGVLMKNGAPYVGVGVNYFDLFSRILARPDDSSSLTNLARLGKAGIPFVRFMCGGYWPSDQKIYLTNQAAFFERLDSVVRAAEADGVGLIPSLFWFSATVPDLMGEHLDQLGNPDSKSIQFVRDYTTAMVRRYHDSPAIWGWEFGNEYTLDCDLPNAAEHRPPVVPELGTAMKRDERDQLRFELLRVALQAFGQAVRNLDSTRPIFTGNAVPRASAWHHVHDKSWVSDSSSQFGEILLRDNPDPADTITIHLYPEKSQIYPGGATSIDAFLQLAAQFADKAKKPLFLGEFGSSRQTGSAKMQLEDCRQFLDSIRKYRIPLAAFWVYDYPAQSSDFNVHFDGENAVILEWIARVNRERASVGP